MNPTPDAHPKPEVFPKSVGAPATRAFLAAGYASVEELSGQSRASLLRLHGVGPKAIRVIQQTLAERGLQPLAP